MGWMIAAAVVLLIVLLFFIRVFVNIEFEDELCVSLKILFLNITLVPAKPKIKKEKKKKPAAKKKKAKEEPSEKKPAEKKKKSASEIIDLVKSVYDIAKKIISMFFGYLAVRVNKMIIVIDGGEPSNTALGYAAAVAGVNSLFALLDNNVNVKYGKDEDIDVRPEFTMKGSSAAIDISFGLRLWQILRLGISAAFAYLKIKSRTEDSDK